MQATHALLNNIACILVFMIVVDVVANSLKFLYTFSLKYRKIMFFMIICVCVIANMQRPRR